MIARAFVASPLAIALVLVWAWAVAVDMVCTWAMHGIAQFIAWGDA